MFRDAALLIAFLRENARWLAAGFLLALGSSFGQTYFIAIFAEPFRLEFGLSHGEWGLIYMLGTLASAVVFIQLGKRAERRAASEIDAHRGARLRRRLLGDGGDARAVGVGAVGVRAASVRPGMLSHLSQTLTARWFAATRGRALAVASFGYPLGEAVTPIAAVALIGLYGWRGAWVVAALVLLLVLAPALWLLLARERTPRSAAEVMETTGLGGRHWSRREVVRSTQFWLLAAALISPSFILTVVYFHPAHIAEIKDWELTDWAAAYSIAALTAVVSSIAVAGRLTAFRLAAC